MHKNTILSFIASHYRKILFVLLGIVAIGIIALQSKVLFAKTDSSSQTKALSHTENSLLYRAQNNKRNPNIVIAAGHVLGIRYSLASSLCKNINSGAMTCTVYPTNHSGESIDALQEGKASFAMAQSDWLHHAKNGTSRFKGYKEGDKLRAIAKFESETIFLAVNKNSGIQDAIDLNNIRMNIGEERSYTRVVSNAILEAVNFSENSLKISLEKDNETAASQLCKNEIDAAVFILPSYSSLIADIMKKCSVRIISFTDKQRRLIKKSLRGFSDKTVPKKTYWRQIKDINTLSLSSVLVTLDSTPVHLVQKWKNAILNNIGDVKKLHPILNGISKDSITEETTIEYYDYKQNNPKKY